MNVFGVTGWKNAGKTGLMERLVAEFCGRGLRALGFNERASRCAGAELDRAFGQIGSGRSGADRGLEAR